MIKQPKPSSGSVAERPPQPAVSDDLVTRVRAWIAEDPDPACRDELHRLLDAGAGPELAERFASELRFGTAGLRGRLGAGPGCMNRATIRRVTAGFARYLLDNVPGAASAGVVVGHDARHGSAMFAAETAAVLSGSGIRALRLPSNSPTPVLAFAVRHLGCAGGVMITASHNPPQDNGYKVYLGDGVQIAPPVDAQIADCMAQVGSLTEVRLGAAGERLGNAVSDAYVQAVVAALPAPASGEPGSVEPQGPASADRPPRSVYTPLHGVARDVLLAAFATANLPAPYVVPNQAEPDPDFPSVQMPNPEESGTLDMALTEAERQGADLMLGNDPDGDRLAVALPEPESSPRTWRILTGDEIGALLARYLLARCTDREHAVVVTTIVSSSLLSRMAADAGVGYRETLTGFKWIMRAGDQVQPRRRILFGYEEALGFAVNDVVRDKDGISAALVICRAAADAQRSGTTLLGQLDDLARRFGLHVTRQISIELSGDRGRQQIAETMSSLRERPPKILAGQTVVGVDDLLHPASVSERRLDLPSSDVIVLRCEDGTRVVVRPSGTEPKLKIYLQRVREVGDEDVVAARGRAEADLDVLSAEIKEILGA